MELYFIFVLFAHSLQGLLAGLPVEVTPERIILLENRPLEVRCRVREPITYCRFSVPGVYAVLSLRPGLPPHEGIQYLGAGLDKGECGILIQSVSSKHSGIIQCTMGLINDITESTGNMTLIVAKPPDPPRLTVYPGTSYRDTFREGDTILVNCRISNARPVANISWYLGSEPIYERLGPTVTEEENGLLSISQNLTRKVTYVDHGKDLKCVAGHIALGRESINHSIYKLNIKFPPKPKSQELEKFGFTIGQPGKIVVTFQANPIPDIMWKVDQDTLKQGTRDRTGRFEAGILKQHKDAGTWDAILIINTVRPEEVEKRYTLIAQNELGQESYKVAISTSPEPPADITAGTIAGIVIAVLVILLLVFILIFARATGRWCFAAGTNGKKSSSEVAIEEGAEEKRPPSIQGKDGVYSSTEYINGNDKKRRSTAARRIYEDGKKSYVCPEERSRLLHDKKFKSSRSSLENKEKVPATEQSHLESGSDSEYEKCVDELHCKAKSYENIEDPKIVTELKRNTSCPGMDSPGDNGRIKLPPYIIPVETSFDFPIIKERRTAKKKNGTEAVDFRLSDEEQRRHFFPISWSPTKRYSSEEQPEEKEAKKRFTVPCSGEKREDFLDESVSSSDVTTKKENGVKEISGTKPEKGEEKPQVLESPVEFFPQEKFLVEQEADVAAKKRYSYGFPLSQLSEEEQKAKERRAKKLDPNPLKKMFRIRGGKKEERPSPGAAVTKAAEDSDEVEDTHSPQESYKGGAVAEAEAESDTESADHGSADKSSMSKLTSERQPKKLMNSLLGSLKKGKNRDKVADNDSIKNPSSFEITIKEQSEDVAPIEAVRTEGIVYAELDMARSPGNLMRREDEKTEYAEIIYPGTKITSERVVEELRKSRENLSSSREDLTEADEAFATTTTPEGKKEAAV